jgi:hypothetical protein
MHQEHVVKFVCWNQEFISKHISTIYYILALLLQTCEMFPPD